MNLCKFRTIFGEAREGFHKTRIPILDWAFFDTAATVLLAYYVSETSNSLGFWLNFVLLIATSRILHKMFCVY